MCRCHDVMVGSGRYRLGLLWKLSCSFIGSCFSRLDDKEGVTQELLTSVIPLAVTNVIRVFNPGSIYNKDLSPKYKQQRQHLLGHPAVTVVSSTDGV